MHDIDERWLKKAEEFIAAHLHGGFKPSDLARALQETFEAGCSAGWRDALSEARDGHIEGISP